MTAIKRI